MKKKSEDDFTRCRTIMDRFLDECFGMRKSIMTQTKIQRREVTAEPKSDF